MRQTVISYKIFNNQQGNKGHKNNARNSIIGQAADNNKHSAEREVTVVSYA
jgi:hypothetical protein